MGFAASPIVANIYLYFALDQPVCAHNDSISFYKRFLDDIFCIHSPEVKLDIMCANTVDNKLSFTVSSA